MTNREWVLKEMQNMSDEELGKIINITSIDKNFEKEWCQKICSHKGYCFECKSEWLNQEHKEKIKLSEVERVILENIDKQYKWIARDETNLLYVYETKPIKDDFAWWGDEHMLNGEVFSHLFQFIKWEDDKPYNIEKLLK